MAAVAHLAQAEAIPVEAAVHRMVAVVVADPTAVEEAEAVVRMAVAAAISN
jgi:hypothetical protein